MRTTYESTSTSVHLIQQNNAMHFTLFLQLQWRLLRLCSAYGLLPVSSSSMYFIVCLQSVGIVFLLKQASSITSASTG